MGFKISTLTEHSPVPIGIQPALLPGILDHLSFIDLGGWVNHSLLVSEQLDLSGTQDY